jgi:hypothetical protein
MDLTAMLKLVGNRPGQGRNQKWVALRRAPEIHS